MVVKVRRRWDTKEGQVIQSGDAFFSSKIKFFFGSCNAEVDTCCLNKILLSCLAFPSSGQTSSQKMLSVCSCAVWWKIGVIFSSRGITHPSFFLSLSHVYTHTGDDKIISFVLIVTLMIVRWSLCAVCPLASHWVITVMKQRQKILSQDLMKLVGEILNVFIGWSRPQYRQNECYT